MGLALPGLTGLGWCTCSYKEVDSASIRSLPADGGGVGGAGTELPGCSAALSEGSTLSLCVCAVTRAAESSTRQIQETGALRGPCELSPEMHTLLLVGLGPGHPQAAVSHFPSPERSDFLRSKCDLYEFVLTACNAAPSLSNRKGRSHSHGQGPRRLLQGPLVGFLDGGQVPGEEPEQLAEVGPWLCKLGRKCSTAIKSRCQLGVWVTLSPVLLGVGVKVGHRAEDGSLCNLCLF